MRKWRHYLLPKEFIVFTDNHALSFLNRQQKLNHRHIKWMEYIQAYTFSMKHKKGVANKVANALSKRNLVVQTIQLESTGIHAIKDQYVEDENFKEPYQSCKAMTGRYNTDFCDFLIQDGFFFKGSLLRIPRGSVRENIIQEKHCGSMASHFGIDKTLDLVRRYYYWPKLPTDVRKFVETCQVYQRAKGHTSNAGLYTPLPIPSKP